MRRERLQLRQHTKTMKMYHWVAKDKNKKELATGSFPISISTSESEEMHQTKDSPLPIATPLLIKAEVLLVCRALGASTPS